MVSYAMDSSCMGSAVNSSIGQGEFEAMKTLSFVELKSRWALELFRDNIVKRQKAEWRKEERKKNNKNGTFATAHFRFCVALQQP